MRRRKFSETDVLHTIQLQLWGADGSGPSLTCYRCREVLFRREHITFLPSVVIDATTYDRIEREHYIELALGGDDAPYNCAYSHAACHKAVTNGTKATTAGSSKQRIAKVKRIQAGGRKKRGPRLQSRGFQQASRPFPKRRKPSAS